MNIKEIECFLNQKVLNSEKFQNYIDYIEKIKKREISSNLKNYLWLLKTSLEIKNKFNESWDNLQKKEYYISWRLLEEIELKIKDIKDNFIIKNNLYNLEIIENFVKNIQVLYPYGIFLSPEIIIQEEKCSICGKIKSIRNDCEHIIGKLYDGEICVGIVEKCEFVGTAMVEKPLQKYTVPFINGEDHYNYEILEKFLTVVKKPFEKWNVVTEEIPLYKNIGRNEKCSCGSGKKYKKCCIKETKKHIILEYPRASN